MLCAQQRVTDASDERETQTVATPGGGVRSANERHKSEILQRKQSLRYVCEYEVLTQYTLVLSGHPSHATCESVVLHVSLAYLTDAT